MHPRNDCYETLFRHPDPVSGDGSARQHTAVPVRAKERTSGSTPARFDQRDTDRLRRSARLSFFGETRSGAAESSTVDYQRRRRHCSFPDRTADDLSEGRRSFR